jgi:uncharacterized protein (TIGR02611 family)
MNWIAGAIIALLLCVATGMVLLGWASLPRQAQDQAGRIARLTLKQARKIVVLVVGVTLVIVGIVMIVAPGPAIVVIPLGLAVLATEFVWARRLLVRYKHHADKMARRVTKHVWTPRPWMVGVIIAATVVAAVVVLIATDWPRQWIISVATSMLVMEAVTMYIVITGADGTVGDNNDGSQPQQAPQDAPPT